MRKGGWGGRRAEHSLLKIYFLIAKTMSLGYTLNITIALPKEQAAVSTVADRKNAAGHERGKIWAKVKKENAT